MINKTLINRLVNKAEQTTTCYRVSAIAFNKKGELLGTTTNSFKMDGRPAGKGSGIHAERRLISRYKNNISTIIICRIGNGGDILPIHPCETCRKVANKMGIKIVSVNEVI
jgi:cytidine deaminase